MKDLIELIDIPGGSFLMGSPESERGRFSDEGPQHLVTVPAFRMGKYLVTQAQWQEVMGNSPSRRQGDDLPATDISWYEFGEFCQRLSDATGDHYRRPTEAEWEYACRAGSTTAYSFGDDAAQLGEYAWFDGNSGRDVHPVGQKKPNAFGLYDMHGNVWEWCEDVWHDDYNGAPTDGSAWLSGGDPDFRVLRGGSWGLQSFGCRSAFRYHIGPDDRLIYFGVRVVVARAR